MKLFRNGLQRASWVNGKTHRLTTIFTISARNTILDYTLLFGIGSCAHFLNPIESRVTSLTRDLLHLFKSISWIRQLFIKSYKTEKQKIHSENLLSLQEST